MMTNLANAIIVQAVKDFRPAYLRIKKNPNDETANRIVREITKFFHSDYFCLLTNLDGFVLLKKIMQEIE